MSRRAPGIRERSHGPLISEQATGRIGAALSRVCRPGWHLLELGHALDVLYGRVAIAQDAVDLVLHDFERLRVLRERIRHPREHRGRCLMPGDEQCDQIVAHLRVVHLLATQIDEKAQHGRIAHLEARRGAAHGAHKRWKPGSKGEQKASNHKPDPRGNSWAHHVRRLVGGPHTLE